DRTRFLRDGPGCPHLGGEDDFAADRKAADQVVAAMPNVLESTRADRRLPSRAGFLAGVGRVG
ncbi:hypothetical protein ACN3XK_26660, partial [Actinomadura welshii]